MEQSPDYQLNMSLLMQPSKMSHNELDSVQEQSRKNDSSFLMQKAGPGVPAEDSINMSPDAERMEYNVKPPRKVSVQR